MDIGTSEGLSILSHNHLNGLVIPSLKDIVSITSLQSKYSPIYSPNKTGLLINTNISKNQKNRSEISNSYYRFLEDTNSKVEKLHSEEVRKIRKNYNSKCVDNQLDKLYRFYYIKNQEQIAKEINILFKLKNFNLKLYIL